MGWRHLSMFVNDFQQKSSTKFHCIICDYHTSRKSNYDKHLLTRKHQKSTFVNQIAILKPANQQYHIAVKYNEFLVYKFSLYLLPINKIETI